MSNPPPIWDADTVSAVLTSLVASEWAHLRPDSPPLDTVCPHLASASLGPDGLNVDSLELMHLATSVAAFFQMHHVGIEDYLLMRRSLPEWTDIVCQSLARYDRTLAFRTSGSTGEPKTIVHALADLQTEAAFWAETFAGCSRIVGVVPRHHIYGFLFTVLLPRALGVPYVDGRLKTPASLGRMLERNTLIVGYPDFWRFVLKARPTWPAGLSGVTSTAPCPDDVAAALVPDPLARLYQVYGSSETAGVGWRLTPESPYELLPFWDKQGPDALQRKSDVTAPSSPYALLDHVDWVEDRRFFVRARKDAAVQVGGINVFPDQVAKRLEALPCVEAAAVRLMNPDEGNRLKAFVVLKSPPEDAPPAERDATQAIAKATVERFINERLAPVERPRAVTFGDRLPRNALGKTADWPIAAQDAAMGTLGGEEPRLAAAAR